MTTKHHKDQHSHSHHSSNGNDDAVYSGEVRRQKRMKSMGIVAIVLMILALIAYVMTNDESVTPNDNREAMPATSE